MIPLLKFAIDAYCHSDRQNLALIELKARIAAQRARLDKIQAVVTEEQLPAHHKGRHTEDAAFDRLPVSVGQ